MPFIEYGQRLYPLRRGENRLGADAGADIRLPDLDGDCQVGISVELQGAFAWAEGDGEPVTINGKPLRREPIPLFHGDRLSVQGSTLVFLDDLEASSQDRDPPAKPATAVAEDPALELDPDPNGPSRVTPPPTERRFVGVLRRHDTDEVYVIDRPDFTIGREKRCDLLIPDHAVSRLHAEITSSGNHHTLHDHGRSPTKLNGHELDRPHKLQPGDVIGIGRYEFTFARRPATAEELAGSDSVTPIRSVVPDAPTLMPAHKDQRGGSRVLTWVLLLALAALLALIVLG